MPPKSKTKKKKKASAVWLLTDKIDIKLKRIPEIKRDD